MHLTHKQIELIVFAIWALTNGAILLFLKGVGEVNRVEVEREEAEVWARMFEYDQLKKEELWRTR